MKFRILVAIYSVFCFALAVNDMHLALNTTAGNGWVVGYTILSLLMVAYGVWAIRLIGKDAKEEREHEEFMSKYGRV